MNFARGADSGAEGLAWLERILKIDPGRRRGADDRLRRRRERPSTRSRPAQLTSCSSRGRTRSSWLRSTAALRLRDSRDEVERLRKRERELVDAASGAAQPVIGDSPRHARSVRARAPRGADRRERADLGRERRRQRARRAPAAPAVETRGRAVHVGRPRRRQLKRCSRASCSAIARARSRMRARDRAGRFQAASGGTLFLDEIGNLPLHLQGKLLSALEQRTVTPLGSDRACRSTCGSCARRTSRSQSLPRGTEFREDLLYRINTVEIRVPPLRERSEDIAPLLEHFVEIYARKYNLPPKRLVARRAEAARSVCLARQRSRAAARVERALIMSDAPTARRGATSCWRRERPRPATCSSSTTTTSRPSRTA